MVLQSGSTEPTLRQLSKRNVRASIRSFDMQRFAAFPASGPLHFAKGVAIRDPPSVRRDVFLHQRVARRLGYPPRSKEATMRMVEIETDMDAAGMAEMKPMFEDLADSAEDVCLDLRGVQFLDSSGVGGIVFLFKRLRERSLNVTLASVKGQPLRLLRQLRLEFLLERRQAASI
jgi:anti-anti-sigma factor